MEGGERELFVVGGVIGRVVDDGRERGEYVVGVVREEIVWVRKLKWGIVVGIEGIEDVMVEMGKGIGIIFIKLVIKRDEVVELFFGSEFFNGDSDCGIILFGWV